MNALAQYLAAKKVNQMTFAAEIGTTQATVSRITRGKQQPGLSLALQIESATNGEVKVSDWPEFAAILAVAPDKQDKGEVSP